jgi:hypothetical protein
MSSICSGQTVAVLAPSQTEPDHKAHQQTVNFLYQAATVLAILLFLISF